MAGRVINSNLELVRDPDFHRRSRQVRRVGWVLMAAIVVLGMLGVLGNGWLSQATVHTANETLRVEYERFGRKYAGTKIKVHLNGPVDGDGKVRFWMSREFLDGMQIRQVSPEPERVEMGPERLTYVFPAPKQLQPLSITLRLEPERAGLYMGLVGKGDDQVVVFSQWIYP